MPHPLSSRNHVLAVSCSENRKKNFFFFFFWRAAFPLLHVVVAGQRVYSTVLIFFPPFFRFYMNLPTTTTTTTTPFFYLCPYDVFVDLHFFFLLFFWARTEKLMCEEQEKNLRLLLQVWVQCHYYDVHPEIPCALRMWVKAECESCPEP